MLKRTNIMVAMMLGALSLGAGATARSAPQPRAKVDPPPRPEKLRAHVRPTRHTPHSNIRECSRRLGGETWRLYKQWDRCERRGLPPL